MGYHWICLVKQALNLRPDQVQQPPRRHQGPKPGGRPHLRYWSYSNIKCQTSKWAQYELMGYQSIGLIKERPNLTISGHYLHTRFDTPLAYTWTVFDKKVDIGVHATAAHEALEGGLFPALQLRPDVQLSLEVAGSELHLSRRIHRYP